MRLDIDHTPRWYASKPLDLILLRNRGVGRPVAVQLRVGTTYYTLWW